MCKLIVLVSSLSRINLGGWVWVNDGIEPELCSLIYASTDDAVEVVLRKMKGTRLAKLDLQSAYWIVPVHPQDRHLLGMKWEGEVYLDSALPFSLRSAP